MASGHSHSHSGHEAEFPSPLPWLGHKGVVPALDAVTFFTEFGAIMKPAHPIAPR